MLNYHADYDDTLIDPDRLERAREEADSDLCDEDAIAARLIEIAGAIALDEDIRDQCVELYRMILSGDAGSIRDTVAAAFDRHDISCDIEPGDVEGCVGSRFFTTEAYCRQAVHALMRGMTSGAVWVFDEKLRKGVGR